MKRIILLILVVAALMVGVYYVRQADQTQQNQISSLYTEVEPLQKLRTTLIEERSKYVEDFQASLRDPSTIQILFREMDEHIFDEVYPVMRENGVTGVLGISTQEFPDRHHKLTMEQFNRLTMDGWGTCLLFDVDYSTRPESWLNSIQHRLDRNSIDMPSAIYFPDGGYNPDTMDELLLSFGITTVVQNAEDGRSNVVTRVGKIWRTGAMPWNYTGIGSDVERLAVTDRGNICFTISINNLWDAFEEKSFAELLNSWTNFLVGEPDEQTVASTPSPSPTSSAVGQGEELQNEPQLRVTTFEKARAAHRKAEAGLTKLIEEHDAGVAEYDRQIEELDNQISEVYNKWK